MFAGRSGAKPSAVQPAGSIFSSLLGFDANSEDEDEGEEAAHKPLGQGDLSALCDVPTNNTIEYFWNVVLSCTMQMHISAISAIKVLHLQGLDLVVNFVATVF